MTSTAIDQPIRGNKMSGRSKILDKPRASIYRLAALNIPNATNTPITFDTVEYDVDGMWNSAAPTLLTCRTQGTYSVKAWISYSSFGVGWRQITIFKNATVVYASSLVAANGAGASTQLCVTSDIALNAGDFVTAVTAHTAGGPIALDTGSTNLHYHTLQACLIST